MKDEDHESYMRWRLVLGQYGQTALGESAQLDAKGLARARALDWLYGRAPAQQCSAGPNSPGSLDPTQLSVPRWLNEVRQLFPKETIETVQHHALERFGIRELITDPSILETLQPSVDLAATLLTFRAELSPTVLAMARKIIHAVVRELQSKIKDRMQRSASGHRRPSSSFARQELANLDWKRTIHQNLRHWDGEAKKLRVRDLYFHDRSQRRFTRRVILVVDQSGSMAHAMIHSSVIASILCGLNHVDARLIAFDTSVVDLSHLCHDPVEVLMSVQLGGGTDIGSALRYAEQQIEDPKRSIVVLVSDFCEGGSLLPMLACTERMHEAGVKLLGLAALDERANPNFNRETAKDLSARGMAIAALTPKKLSQWLIQQIS